MNRTASALVIFALSVSPAFAANKGTDAMKACAAAWKALPSADQGKTTYKAYSSDCLKNGGPKTASATAMTAAAPEGATGQCKDGTYTKAKNHSGACSSHGGVAKWL